MKTDPRPEAHSLGRALILIQLLYQNISIIGIIYQEAFSYMVQLKHANIVQ